MQPHIKISDTTETRCNLRYQIKFFPYNKLEQFTQLNLDARKRRTSTSDY